MGSNWKTARLLDQYEVRSGLSKPAKDFGTGYPFLTFKDVFYNYFTPEVLGDLVESTDKERDGCSVKRGDVFLTRTSETMNELGMSCVALKDYEGATFNGFCKRLRPNEQCELVPEYVGYYLRSPKFRQAMLAFSTMSTRASLNNEMIGRLEISYPPKEAQRHIAHVLKTFDNKITLNRQINQTLEQMAQTLFKSWFVDFDPVIDNALDAGNPIPDELQHRAEARKAVRQGQAAASKEHEGFKPLPDEVRQLFPDAFEESELGWVPKGWAVKTCEEISTRIGMGPFGSNIKVSTFVDSGIPVISGTHLKSVLLNDHSYNFITEEHAQKLKNSAVYRGDIVFTHAGNIGQVALIPDESEYESYMISQRQFYLRPDSSQVKSSYIVHYFHSHLGQHKLLSNASQTGVPSIARPSSHLKGIALVIPSNEVQESFDGLVTRWNEKTMRTRNNIDLLTKLRDTLLPKLISGELRLDDVEAAVEQDTVSA